MKNLHKNYVEPFKPKVDNKKEGFPFYSEEDYNRDNKKNSFQLEKNTKGSEKPVPGENGLEDSVVEEVEYDDQTTLKVTPSSNTDMVLVDTNVHDNLSKLEGSKVRFVDFYRDARTFLEKANSTKFVLVSYVLLSIPVLLILGYLSEEVYREILIIISLTYLGVDAYEKKTQVRKRKD